MDPFAERAGAIGNLANIHADTGDETVAKLLVDTMQVLHDSMSIVITAGKPKGQLVTIGGTEHD